MAARLPAQSRQAAATIKSSKDQRPSKKQKLSQPQVTSYKANLEVLIPRKGDGKKFVPPPVNGTEDSARSHKFDESKAVIGNGIESDVDMEDAEEEDSEDEDDEDVEDDRAAKHDDTKGAAVGKRKAGKAKALTNGATARTNGYVGEDDGAEAAPSFEELIENQESIAVDVDDALGENDPDAKALTAGIKRNLSIPTGISLGTYLTQALKTNDKDQLEACFLVNDLDSVRSTIERLDSPLVADLLQRLAERLHKKPGRAANLMVWVQWSFVAHGGYLASQPDVVRKLRDLHRVIKERASALQPLLSLKGKLDMLSAQLDLRRNMQPPVAVGEDDDEAPIYVEGDESEEEAQQVRRTKQIAVDVHADSDDESDGDDEMKLTMADESEDEDSDEDSDVIDDEAEETDRDSGDDLSEPESDEEDEMNGFINDDVESESEEDEDEEEEEEETRPSKRSKAASRR